jgi:hypothetical protein
MPVMLRPVVSPMAMLPWKPPKSFVSVTMLLPPSEAVMRSPVVTPLMAAMIAACTVAAVSPAVYAMRTTVAEAFVSAAVEKHELDGRIAAPVVEHEAGEVGELGAGGRRDRAGGCRVRRLPVRRGRAVEQSQSWSHELHPLGLSPGGLLGRLECLRWRAGRRATHRLLGLLLGVEALVDRDGLGRDRRVGGDVEVDGERERFWYGMARASARWVMSCCRVSSYIPGYTLFSTSASSGVMVPTAIRCTIRSGCSTASM